MYTLRILQISVVFPALCKFHNVYFGVSFPCSFPYQVRLCHDNNVYKYLLSQREAQFTCRKQTIESRSNLRFYRFLYSHNQLGNEVVYRNFQVFLVISPVVCQIVSYLLICLISQNPSPLLLMSQATTAAQQVFWFSGMKCQRMTRMELLRATTLHTKIGELEQRRLKP